MTKKESLLEEAKAFGLSFAKNAKTETIEKAIAQAKEEAEAAEAVVEAGGSVEEPTQGETTEEIEARLRAEFEARLESEKRKLQANMEVNLIKKGQEAAEGKVSIGQARLKARREAMALERVIVTCKDPAKANWDGEIITVSNDVVGDVKKYVPYNLDEGYHVPRIILNMLKDRKCTIFVNKKGRDGKYVQVAKTINAHSIEYLPPLTEEELTELAREQAARVDVD